MKPRALCLVACLAIVAVLGCYQDSAIEEQMRLRSEAHERNEALLRKLTNQFPSSEPAHESLDRAVQLAEHERWIELADLGLILRKVDFDEAIDSVRRVYFSETEITNRIYAAYLADTRQVRDDAALEEAAKLPTSSTVAPLVFVENPKSLWRNGKPPAGRDEHPVSFVTTAQAMEFCAWLNGRYDVPGLFRLPTEDEWLFAAYGRHRKFPWGDDERDWRGQDTEPVKARPELRTPDGLCGIWGNVSELVLSPSDGYGGILKDKHSPIITKWMGTCYQETMVRGRPTQPRQDEWGYTHSSASRSDTWGFRIVFVPKDPAE